MLVSCSQLSTDMYRVVENLSRFMCMFPAEFEQGATPPFSHTINKCPLHCLVSETIFTFVCYLLVISLFKMAPTLSAKVFSSVHKHRKAVMCLREKIHVSDKLHSGTSYDVLDKGVNTNKSTTYIK